MRKKARYVRDRIWYFCRDLTTLLAKEGRRIDKNVVFEPYNFTQYVHESLTKSNGNQDEFSKMITARVRLHLNLFRFGNIAERVRIAEKIFVFVRRHRLLLAEHILTGGSEKVNNAD